jgi:hypothetical protein
MSFKRFDIEDIVISSDAATAPAWSNNVVSLNTFYTSSDQVARSSGDYYWNIFQTGSEEATAAIQFSIAYGDLEGSGSLNYNTNVVGASPSQVIYKQYRTLINGTEETNLKFAGYESKHVYAISVERARYKEKLLPASLSMTLTSGSNTIRLTDDSQYASTITYGDSGREYEIISGSAGVRTSSPKDGTYGYTTSSGSYGKFLPDVGIVILNGSALDQPVLNGGIVFSTNRTSNTAANNNARLYHSLINGSNFSLRSEETISSNYIFVRARNSEFNYSTNPSNITGSGELRHDIMIDTPQSYITAVGLYNDNNDLLAVAKLSRPLLKDFTKEALIRIKLDY